MSSKVKAKIIEIFYNRENNLFQLLLEDLDNKKQTQIAIKGTDWGVTSDISEEIINKFCEDMAGQEKTIHIETENSSLRDAKKDDTGIVAQEEINKTYKSLDNYPIDEVMNILHEDSEKNEDYISLT